MAWTSPMTAVANTALTAAQWNTHVRDNLLQTAPAKATTAGGIFAATGANAIAERIPSTATVTTSQSTSSTSYTNLATSGPAVTVTTGTKAIVAVSANCEQSALNSMYMSHAVSGATTNASSDNFCIRHRPDVVANNVFQGSHVSMYTTLTAGSNTFTAKYRVAGGTGTWSMRRLIVIPF